MNRRDQSVGIIAKGWWEHHARTNRRKRTCKELGSERENAEGGLT